MFLKSFFVLLTLTTTAIADEGLDRLMGKELFERSWVQAPATTKASDGLGPLFNARSCASCHPRGGSVGFETTENRTQSAGLLARFGDGTGAGDPHYGKQLQSAALTTLQPEGQVWLDERFNVGLELNGPGLASTTGVGLRRAPTLAGRGLFSDISDKALLKNADPLDANKDGISGRARIIDGRLARFGWKADHVTLEDQIATAFAMDIGLSSQRAPNHFTDCTAQQSDCRAFHDGSDDLGAGYELSEAIIDLVSLYVASLGTQRPGSQQGLALFEETGCAACHTPAIEGGNHPVQIYSDLLLHDMGPELRDGFKQPGVLAAEWRTAPLIGLSTSNSRLLHDGRAEDVREAIDWHGGESQSSKGRFNTLSRHDQEQLIAYVSGL
ncbi:MAG: di-heme oxidoredictase family protein [Paracoccaceae bacterium]